MSRPRVSAMGLSVAAFPVLTLGAWVALAGSGPAPAHPFASAATLRRLGAFLGELLGVGAAAPAAFSSADAWERTGRIALDTLAMSVLAMGIASVLALALMPLAAHTITPGTRVGSARWAGWGAFGIARVALVLLRGVPELVWALVAVFLFAPGILPGALALGLHNGGVLGRIGAELAEDADPGPVRALRTAGAGRTQVLAYAIVPGLLPRLLTFALYRWEVAVRASVVVGLVGAGGLGLELRLAMSRFDMTHVALVLAWYLLLVVAVDTLTGLLRRLAR
jgi:phosphonate transport system permease protein